MKVGLRMGLFDNIPLVQRIRPAGTWENKHAAFLRRPSVWEGLLA